MNYFGDNLPWDGPNQQRQIIFLRHKCGTIFLSLKKSPRYRMGLKHLDAPNMHIGYIWKKHCEVLAVCRHFIIRFNIRYAYIMEALIRNEKALKTIHRTKSSSQQPRQLPGSRDSLALYRAILDAVLKTGAVALPIPAILIHAYLRLIGHTELFSASVLSLAGLSALLQAFLLVWLAFVACIVAPSTIIYAFLGGTSSKRPSRGLPAFVLLSSGVWALSYAIAFEVWDHGLTGWEYGLIVATLALVGSGLLGWLAWKSPGKLIVVPYDDRDAYLHWADWLVNLANRNACIAQAASFIRRRRVWRCVGVMVVIIMAGAYSTQAILTVYSLGALPEHGWRVSASLCVIILASLLPSAIYLKARASGQSHWNSLKIAATVIGTMFIVALINGFSLAPLALGTMRAMAIIDNTPRTYEIMKAEERPIYHALGYKPKASDRFVEAFVRFEFADVKFVCPHQFDLSKVRSFSPHERRVASSNNATVSAEKPEAAQRADSAGCLTPTKDEIRTVDLPNGFRDPTAPTNVSDANPGDTTASGH